MKVFVLNRWLAYEGETTLGVYSTREAAMAAARADAGGSLDHSGPDWIGASDYASACYHLHEIQIDAPPENH